MPSHWTGTVEDRWARLEKFGRRCDGNDRRCVHGAIETYTLAPSRDWVPIPGAEPVTKMACTRHRMQFCNNSNYTVLSVERSPRLHEQRADQQRPA